MQENDTTIRQELQALGQDAGRDLEPVQGDSLSQKTAKNIIDASLEIRFEDLDEALQDGVIDTACLAHLSLEGEVTHG